MTGLLRSILPISTPNHDDDDDDYNVEYSFAIEYTGPPVDYVIPRIGPIDVDRIPTAAVSATTSAINTSSLPVIQPIVKTAPTFKKLSNSSKVGPESKKSPTPAIFSGKFYGPSVNESFCGSVSSRSAKLEQDLVEFRDDDPSTSQRSDENGSSSILGFSDSRDDSNEISGSSDHSEEGPNSGIYINRANSDLIDSRLRSPALSSDVSSCEGEICAEEAPCEGNRIISIETSSEPYSSDSHGQEIDRDEPFFFPEKPEANTNVKKGLCHKCHKGNRFTEKEVCIVCRAKYCNNCVLRAMGSMPEGRKCITCIGYRIDESKRASLGKSSRMLKRLLTDEQVNRIMNSELSCEANQLPPQLIWVNGKQISIDELVLLQSCRNPPKRLKPGKYWYDKVAGFWGKEGQKPCQIITPELAVGLTIMPNASNGDTNIKINNREITKAELWMLKLAEIQCEGNPNFWLGPDGSIQQEGQKNVMGNIWDKIGIKLVCAVLSLPVPPKLASSSGVVDNGTDKVDTEQIPIIKFLLVGSDQSGTSTLFKQAKMVYNIPFSEAERQNVKFVIQSNLYRYLGILLEGREWFEGECMVEMRKKLSEQPSTSGNPNPIDEKNIYSISPKLKAFSNWFLQIMMSGNLEAIFPAANREYAPLIEELWNDRAIQATYNRRNELMLSRAANYFLDKAVDVLGIDYEPSDMDILYAEGITSSNGLACMEFSFPNSTHDSFMDSADQDDPLRRYQLIRVHASSLGERCKWLEMFEDIDLVLYSVSLTDYDQLVEESEGVFTNKMMASKKLFENIITHPTFANKDFLLILNKFDLLEEKIEQISLNQCDWFNDFNPVISHNHNSSSRSRCSNNTPSLAHRAFHYIAVKFKRVFHSLTGRKLYVSAVNGLEGDSVDEALRYGREILKWDCERPSLTMNEWSSDSIEATTTTS